MTTIIQEETTMESYSTVSGGLVETTDDVVYLCDEMFNFETISGVSQILIFIFSVTGNCLLLLVLVTQENLRNVTNLFVLNLACSDLIFTVTLPFWAVHQLHHWIFGEFTCKLMIAAYIVGLYSSIILLTAMTVDRFIIVVLHNMPSYSVRRQRFAIVACVAAWVISTAASLSDAIKVKVEDSGGISFCEVLSDEHDVKLGYYLQVSLLFFLPLAIIVFCYSAILKTVLQASNRKTSRTVVLVLCIVAAFFICWGPHSILLFIGTLYEPKDCNAQERLEIAFSICHILAYSHCCMNPLLYMHSKKMRKHLLDFLCCEKAKKKKRERATGQSTQIVASVAENSAVTFELHSK
ncbi:chemokine XC receptor 1-like isoform X1 [Anoplopoma fimbria]|uniref:chemokine XC receptor 1-like isoform X1 n=1 Tax=Anoplopoma fimbria TaxID=229290 RepID=UPI0023EDE344|nr:chemokine XC receptor 1-like isoform X1 [Anoplopoma fimbria]